MNKNYMNAKKKSPITEFSHLVTLFSNKMKLIIANHIKELRGNGIKVHDKRKNPQNKRVLFVGAKDGI